MLGFYQDQKKIDAKIKELKDTTKEDWLPVTGNHALIKAEGEFKGGKIVFFPNKGAPLKGFINKKTGEIKIFPAKLFEKDE